MPTALENWERKLRLILDEADAALEAKFGIQFCRNPVRPPAGSAGSRQYDGLFAVRAAYTAGFGSDHGEGYAVDIRWGTPDEIPAAAVAEAETITREILNQRLPEEFPGKNLRVEHDIAGMKIVGDLSLQ